MCYLDGQMVAGMGPQPEAMAAAGAPSMWNSYVFVEDVDAIAVAAEAAGGSVLMPAMDVMESGRMAMIASPDGAVVGAWQPTGAPGGGGLRRSGCPDLERAAVAQPWSGSALPVRGLRMALGASSRWRWSTTSVTSMRKLDDTTNCGAMNMPDGVPPEAPSMWVVYFAVGDCDASAAAVPGLGGELFMPPMEMGPGKFAGRRPHGRDVLLRILSAGRRPSTSVGLPAPREPGPPGVPH